jgi:gluconate kinase
MKSGQPNRLDSQFAAFEPPGSESEENPIAVDTDRPLGEIVKSIFGVLYLEAPRPR